MLRGLSADIAHSRISGEIQDHTWIVPAVQSVHILAIAALVFAAFSANLAILRSPAAVHRTPWLSGSYRWTWTALAVLLVSGAILITGEPTRSIMNVYFRVKIALIIVAAALTLILQRSLARRDGSSLSDPVLIALAGASVVTWVAIVFCGRFIAYFGNLAD